MTGVSRDLEVAVRTVAGVRVASVRGEVDLGTRDRFERALEPVREAEGPAVLDLGEVPFMDSSGLHVVVQLWQALRAEGRVLAVSCGSDHVRKLFELTALDGVLPVYDDAASAAAALNGSQPDVSERAS